MRLVARATDRRLQILERGDAGEVAHADPLSRENDRRCIDSRNGLYRLLDMGDAGRARHSRYTQLDRHFRHAIARSEEHTSELQSLMRISYAVFCLKKKIKTTQS